MGQAQAEIERSQTGWQEYLRQIPADHKTDAGPRVRSRWEDDPLAVISRGWSGSFPIGPPVRILLVSDDASGEMAIRAALGASDFVSFVIGDESLLLALLSGLAGWPLAVWGLKTLVAVAPQDVPRLATVTIDTSALLFSLGVTLLTALFFGVAPALQLSKVDINGTLKDAGSEGRQGVRQQRLGNLLITSEVAFALMLLIGGGLLARTVWQLQRVNPGFDERNALTVQLQLSEKKYVDDRAVGMFSQQLVHEVSKLPGVEATAVARILPILHKLPTGFYVEGRQRERDNQLPDQLLGRFVRLLQAMGIPVVAGRALRSRRRTVRA